VQIDRSGFLQHPSEFDQARSHHRQISHHVAAAEEGAEGAHRIRDATAHFDDLFVGPLGVDVPFPRVFEGVNLRAGLRAILLGEEDVVILAGIEGRNEIDEVHRSGPDVALQDFKVVPVIELILQYGHNRAVALLSGEWQHYRSCETEGL
jgi:hypothetical protein